MPCHDTVTQAWIGNWRPYLAARGAKVRALDPVCIGVEGLEGVGPVQRDKAKLAVLGCFLCLWRVVRARLLAGIPAHNPSLKAIQDRDWIGAGSTWWNDVAGLMSSACHSPAHMPMHDRCVRGP